MKKELIKISKYCEKNNVEINFDGNGSISIWTGNDGLPLKIDNIEASKVTKAIDALNSSIRYGWEPS